MTFRREGHEVFDPNSGAKLQLREVTKDEYYNFSVIFPDGTLKFSTEAHLNKDARVCIWKVLKFGDGPFPGSKSLLEMRAIIADALRAYGTWGPSDYTIEVVFY